VILSAKQAALLLGGGEKARAGFADEKRRVHASQIRDHSFDDPEASGHAFEDQLAEGLGHGEAGMETEEGTAFEFLPRRSPVKNGLFGLTPYGRSGECPFLNLSLSPSPVRSARLRPDAVL